MLKKSLVPALMILMTALRKVDATHCIIPSGKTLALFVHLFVHVNEGNVCCGFSFKIMYSVHKFIFVLKKMTIIF